MQQTLISSRLTPRGEKPNFQTKNTLGGCFQHPSTRQHPRRGNISVDNSK